MLDDIHRNHYLNALGIDRFVLRSGGDAETESPAPPASQEVPDNDDPWNDIQKRVAACTACELHKCRTQTVFGSGTRGARLMIIGEAPGAEEDRRGQPFVGRAGQLLEQMLAAIGLRRDQVFIANMLKCRPPGNRDPKPEEIDACRAFLREQLQLVKPELLLAVGRIAAQNLLGSNETLARMRDRTHAIEDGQAPLIVTYHPAFLLRSPAYKRKAWADLCTVRDILDSR